MQRPRLDRPSLFEALSLLDGEQRHVVGSYYVDGLVDKDLALGLTLLTGHPGVLT